MMNYKFGSDKYKLDSWSDIKNIENQTCIKFNNGIMIIIAYSEFIGTANPSKNNILNLCHPYRDANFLVIPIHTGSDSDDWHAMSSPLNNQKVEFQTFNLSNGIVPIITFGFWK